MTRRPMRDVEVVLLAVAAVGGAWAPHALPVWPLAAVGVAAWSSGRPWLLIASIVVLTSGLAATAHRGLELPRLGPVAADAELLTDPAPSAYGRSWGSDVRVDGKHWLLQTTNADITSFLAGEWIHVTGTAVERPPGSDWLEARHVVGVLRVERVEWVSAGALPSRLANGLRRALVRGASSMSDDDRALFTGLVIGDDRDQRASDADAFRAAGLTHLLAVSGQNVAFVLALAAPLTRRLLLWPRLAVTLSMIVFFALVTRFEPSVLRASVMAGTAAWSATIGHPTRGIRLLALSVTGLVLVDPLLVHALGFALSASASAGILLLSGPLVRVLPGPHLLRTALAVTLAAQAGVAPIALVTFGPMPVASLPANVLAEPAAGWVMMWGLGAGLIAGWLDVGWLSAAIQVPNRLLINWIQWVATTVPRLVPGHVGVALAAALGTVTLAAVLLRRPAARALGATIVVVSLAVVGVQAPVASDDRDPPVGAELLRAADGATVLSLDGRARAGPVLQQLRSSRINDVDLLILRSDASNAARTADEVAGAVHVHHRLDPLHDPQPPSQIRIGCIVVDLVPADPWHVRLTDRCASPAG